MKEILNSLLDLITASFLAVDMDLTPEIQSVIDGLHQKIDALDKVEKKNGEKEEEKESEEAEARANSEVQAIFAGLNDLATKLKDGKVKNEALEKIKSIQMKKVDEAVKKFDERQRPLNAARKPFNMKDFAKKVGDTLMQRGKVTNFMGEDFYAAGGEAFREHWKEIIKQLPQHLDIQKQVVYLGQNDMQVDVFNYDDTDGARLYESDLNDPDAAKKVEQSPAISSVNLTSGQFYKKLSLSYNMIKKNPQLVEFRLNELPEHWMLGVYEAVVSKGLGATISNGKIVGYKYIQPICINDENLDDPTYNAARTAFVTPVQGAITLQNAMTMVNAIARKDRAILFGNRASLQTLREHVAATGGTVDYWSFEEVAAKLGIAAIHECAALPANTLVAFDPKGYAMVGTPAFEAINGYDLEFNHDILEVVGLVGGGFIAPKAGACLKP